MNKQYRTYFDAIFIQRDTWIFAGAILLMSLVMTNWSAPYTWGEYLGYIGILGVSYSPILWFSWYKKEIYKNTTWLLYLLCWLGSHLIYPLVFALFQYEYQFFAYPELEELFQIAGVGQFFIAVALETNTLLGKKIKQLTWLGSLSLEKSILLVLGFLSLFIGFIAMTEVDLNVPFDEGFLGSVVNFFYYVNVMLRFGAQIFIGFVSLYFFYYLNHYLLIPYFLRKRGLLIYAAAVIGAVVLFYPVFAQLIAWLPLNQAGWDLLPSEENISFDGLNGLIPFMVMLVSVPVIIAIQWHQQNNQIVSLEKQQTATELSLLKQQVNPHFFFNTLNNLYALSLKKSNQTPEVIMQLADLMRYVIYKGKETLVPIQGEVQYLKDYIQLQQIRLHKKLDLRFTTDLQDEERLLPPLLFIILVENAFKHGIEPAENTAYLHLDLCQQEETLIFTCENSVEEKENKDTNRGIGLDNLQRRLELLFPDRFELTILDLGTSFKTSLRLELESIPNQSQDSAKLVH